LYFFKLILLAKTVICERVNVTFCFLYFSKEAARVQTDLIGTVSWKGVLAHSRELIVELRLTFVLDFNIPELITVVISECKKDSKEISSLFLFEQKRIENDLTGDAVDRKEAFRDQKHQYSIVAILALTHDFRKFFYISIL